MNLSKDKKPIIALGVVRGLLVVVALAFVSLWPLPVLGEGRLFFDLEDKASTYVIFPLKADGKERSAVPFDVSDALRRSMAAEGYQVMDFSKEADHMPPGLAYKDIPYCLPRWIEDPKRQGYPLQNIEATLMPYVKEKLLPLKKTYGIDRVILGMYTRITNDDVRAWFILVDLDTLWIKSCDLYNGGGMPAGMRIRSTHASDLQSSFSQTGQGGTRPIFGNRDTSGLVPIDFVGWYVGLGFEDYFLGAWSAKLGGGLTLGPSKRNLLSAYLLSGMGEGAFGVGVSLDYHYYLNPYVSTGLTCAYYEERLLSRNVDLMEQGLWPGVRTGIDIGTMHFYLQILAGVVSDSRDLRMNASLGFHYRWAFMRRPTGGRAGQQFLD